MKHSFFLYFSLFTLHFSLFTLTASAQGTVNDYKNAYAIRGKYSNKMTYGNVRVINQNRRRGENEPHTFYYSVQSDTGLVYKKVDADANTVTILPSNPEPPRRNWQNRGPQRHWMEVPDEKDGVQRSNDGAYTIFHKDNNLWVRTPNDSIGKPLTTNGDSTYYYSSWGSFSPDNKYYATVRIKPAPKHYVYYVESSPRNQVQPILHKQEYAKPGDSLNYRVPVIVEVATGKVKEVPTSYIASQYNVSAPSWERDSKSVTFEFNERGHHNFYVYEFFAETGEVRTLIHEHSDKYVNYNRQYRHDFRNGKYILWTSERDNYNNIYLYDRKTGKLIRQITKGGFYVRGIQRVDEEKGIIYFSANGKTGLRESDKRGKNASFAGTNATEEDPYLIHYYKINLNGKGLTCLTPEEGNHKVTFTEDYKYLIDTYSTVLNPPVTVLRSAEDGKILRTLETANISKLEATGWKAPEVFVAKGRDGKTDMWGLIQRPSNFDPSKKYPVIEYIYSGPGDQYVPKDFTPWLYNLADLAELGFIVVQLDGMTTSFRSREFEDVCYKNLADSGFPDRIAWIKAAAEKYPYMDADNVGIYGCSAGGQEALGAVLFHGDFYKAAYAACGCHDNRMDKIWWNEQWMSYPIDQSYIASSNVANAYRLERPLMLLVGELDDNVDPASTMQVVNALQKANKDFELVVIPGAHHTMGESYGEHKRYDFFVRHLLGINPPKWNDIK